MWTLGVDKIALRIRMVEPGWLLLATGLLAVLVAIQAWRWKFVVQVFHADAKFSLLLRFVFIGNFFSQLLPSSIGGDAVRFLLLSRKGLSKEKAFMVVLLDRIVALLGLILLSIALVPSLFYTLGMTHATMGFAFTIALSFVAVALLFFLEPLTRWFANFRLVQGLQAVSRGLSRLIRSEVSIKVLLLSVLIQAGLAMVVSLIGRALHISADDWMYLLLVPPVMLVTMVPLSIAGWGIREGAMTFALGMVGISAVNAVSISILFGAVIALTSLPGGFLWISDVRKADI